MVVSAVRALGQMQATASAAALATVAAAPGTDPNVRLEALGALGRDEGERRAGWSPRTCSPTSGRRCAPRRSARPRRSIPTRSPSSLSGLEPDRDWHVRAARGRGARRAWPPDVALDRARLHAAGRGQARARAVLGALVQLKAPDAAEVLTRYLKDPDFVVRSAAAAGLGQLKPARRRGDRCVTRTMRRWPTRRTARAARSSRRWPAMVRRTRRRRSRPRSPTRTGRSAFAPPSSSRSSTRQPT